MRGPDHRRLFRRSGYKDIPDLARLGFPIGEVGEDGSLVITKVEGSGGAVTAQTCREQLLYEVHDPRAYIQPDVVADFSQVRIEQIAPDRVRVSGGRGTKRTDTLKVSVGYVDSFIGEGQISYAGPGALARDGWRWRSCASGSGLPVFRQANCALN